MEKQQRLETYPSSGTSQVLQEGTAGEGDGQDPARWSGFQPVHWSYSQRTWVEDKTSEVRQQLQYVLSEFKSHYLTPIQVKGLSCLYSEVGRTNCYNASKMMSEFS